MSFTIRAKCSNSGRHIEIGVNNELDIDHVTSGADPMFCLPIVSLANTKEPSIVDIF
ncbi:hypothetical protein ACFL1N_00260 [Thermodesulfobacteriota bacterium]